MACYLKNMFARKKLLFRLKMVDSESLRCKCDDQACNASIVLCYITRSFIPADSFLISRTLFLSRVLSLNSTQFQ